MGAKVISMSWGDYSFSYVLRDVISYAYSKNVVLVGSAGNSNSSDPHYPSGYSEVICVGNSTENDYRSSDSNFGSTLDLMAPGSSILSTDMEGGYRFAGGTSAATPHVAATAALILSLQNFTNEEVKQIIKSTTDDIEEPGWDIRSGAGRLNTYKAVTTLAPSIIKFNTPYQDYSTFEDQLNVNVTVLSASFSSYSLFVGAGFNPDTWTTLISSSSRQVSNEDIYNLDLTSMPDNVYCMRLVVNLTNGRTLEERVNFHIIRTPPKVIEVADGPLYYGNQSTIAGEFFTDQVCVMKMYYRKYGETTFNFVTLDGFNTNNQFVKQEHWGFIPKEIVQPNTLYEVYFEAENLVGLKTTVLDTLNNLDYYRFLTEQPPSVSTYDEKSFRLPKGTLLSFPVNFLSNNNNEVFLQAYYETPELIFGLYKYENNSFVKVDSIYNKYPKSFGDFNNNGLKDLISTSRQNIILDEQLTANSFDSLVTKYTDADSNNPLIVEDLNSNGDYELLTLTNGDRLIKWDINSDLTISNANTFYTKSDTLDIEPGYEFSNYPSTNVEVADVDNDGKKEIWFLDDDGDLKSFVVQPSGQLTRGNSFITQGLITRNPNIFSIGDYNGDGIKDFAVLYQTNSIAPTFLLLIFTYRNNDFQIITQKVFLDQADEFIGFTFSEAYQSIKFADVDSDGSDELIINIFPYSYILDFDFGENKFTFYLEGTNTEGVYANDLNGNGMLDVAFQFSDGYKFFEFGPPTRPEIPTILNAFSNSSLQTELSWVQSTDKYYIYRGSTSDNLQLYDSISTNSYIDNNVSELNTYYYAIQSYDQFLPDPYSKLSSPVEIFIHRPATVDTVYASSNRSVIVHFTEKMNNTIENLQAFKLNNSIFPNSISPASQYSYLLSFNGDLPVGTNQLVISDLKDLYNSPIQTDTISFEVSPDSISSQFFISSFEIINAYEIKIVFNFEVDEVTATNPDNYIFTPDNKVTSAKIDGNDNKIVYLNLKGQKPVGSVGREYVLQLKNIKFTRPQLETWSLMKELAVILSFQLMLKIYRIFMFIRILHQLQQAMEWQPLLIYRKGLKLLSGH